MLIENCVDLLVQFAASSRASARYLSAFGISYEGGGLGEKFCNREGMDKNAEEGEFGGFGIYGIGEFYESILGVFPVSPCPLL